MYTIAHIGFFYFKYDYVSKGEYYPSSVSIEDLNNDEIDREIQTYNRMLLNQISLSNIEDLDPKYYQKNLRIT